MPVHSGANDVLAFFGPPQAEGGAPRLASTPFTVCFGKGKVTRPLGKNIKLYVNSALCPVEMVLAGDGYAVFPEQQAAAAALSAEAKKLQDEEAAAIAAEAAESKSKTTEGAFRSWLMSKTQQVVASVAGSPTSATAAAAAAAAKKEEEEEEEADSEASPTDELDPNDANLTAEGIAVEQRRIQANENADCQMVPDSALLSPDPVTAQRLPTHEQLSKLNLRPGKNELVFQTWSNIHGTVYEQASLYLVDCSTEVCVSDIDGTVSKSDIRGHVYSRVYGANSWVHDNICDLYQKVVAGDASSSSSSPSPRSIFVYLTARGVGQVHGTRDFLGAIAQGSDGSKKLPEGVVMMAPEGLMSAIKHELRKQAHIAKVRTLSDVRRAHLLASSGGGGSAVVGGSNPLSCAFGNRLGDVRAYTACGVPVGRQFIINTSSLYQMGARLGKAFTVEEITKDLPALFAKVTK